MESGELVQKALMLIRQQPPSQATPSLGRIGKVSNEQEREMGKSVSEGVQRRDAIQALMWQDLLAHNRWMARAYQELSPEARQTVLQKLSGTEEAVDRAYAEGNWVAFQAALVEAKGVMAEAGGFATVPQGEHWIYRTWSRLLDAEVWFIHCGAEVRQLAERGIRRGAIYTEAELMELLHLPQEGRRETLKSIHLVKTYFDGTVIPHEQSRQGNAPSSPPPPVK